MAYQHIKEVPPEIASRVAEAVAAINGDEALDIISRIMRENDGPSKATSLYRSRRDTVEASCTRA